MIKPWAGDKYLSKEKYLLFLRKMPPHITNLVVIVKSDSLPNVPSWVQRFKLLCRVLLQNRVKPEPQRVNFEEMD